MSSSGLRFFLKLAISAALIWVIIERLGLADVAERVKAMSVGGMLLVVLLLLLQCVVASIRWEWIIRVMGYFFPFTAALKAWLIGYFLGQGFPSTIGQDAFRAIRLRNIGVPTSISIEIIVMDRFTGVVALVLLAALTLPVFFSLASDSAPLWPVALVIGCGILGTGLLFSTISMPKQLARFKIAALISRFRSNLKRLAGSPNNLLWTFLPALVAHLLTVLAAYIIAWDGGTRIGFLQCLAIIPPAIFVSLIPISIAGWGIREGSIVAAGLLIGIPSADALFMSVMLGLGFLVVGLIGGVVWLVTGARRPMSRNNDSVAR